MSRLNLKANPDNPVEVALLEYLEANASDSLAERINAGNKTIDGCYRYIKKEAEKKVKEREGVQCVPMPREECYCLAIHYFEEDSIKVTVEEVAPNPPPHAPSAPVKAKGRRAKVAVASVPVDAAKVSVAVDELLADYDVTVAEEKPAEPEPEPEPEAPPAPAERKEPQQMDWLAEFGISV